MINQLPLIIFDKAVINLAIQQTLSIIPTVSRNKQAIMLGGKKYRIGIEKLVANIATILMLAKTVESDVIYNQMIKEVDFDCKNPHAYEFISVMVNDNLSTDQTEDQNKTKLAARVKEVMSRCEPKI